MQLFVFMWTPLLEETAGGYIHPGSVFVCFMLARLIGCEMFELFKIIMQTNSYKITIYITVSSCLSFLVDYFTRQFNIRFFMFVYYDGASGIFYPMMSSLKSQMIPEKLRTTIMNFFRMPTSIFAIISLIITKFITTYEICLLTFGFMFIGSCVNLYLLIIHEPPDYVHRKIETTSHLIEQNKELKKNNVYN